MEVRTVWRWGTFSRALKVVLWFGGLTGLIIALYFYTHRWRRHQKPPVAITSPPLPAHPPNLCSKSKLAGHKVTCSAKDVGSRITLE